MKPNILFLFPDQHRGDWMPYPKEILEKFNIFEDFNIEMPNIKKLMDTGTTFTNAITSSPVCAPARACLANGYRYQNCGVPNNLFDYDTSIETFYTRLKNEGYIVSGVGKFDLHKPTQFWGLDGWVPFLEEVGFTRGIDNAGKYDAANSGKIEAKDPYMKLLHENGLAEYYSQNIASRGQSTEAVKIPQELYCDNWISQNAINEISSFPKNKPWFMQVNFTGPHNPWDITADMKSKWENTDFPLPHNFDFDNSYDINAIRQNYAAMLNNIDKLCGDIIKTVEERGEIDNTIIIYSSDHGEMLGDSYKFGKSMPNKGSIHIPLVIKGANISENYISDALVELQDLASTILDITDICSSITDESISLKNTLYNREKFSRKYQESALNEPNRGDWRIIQDYDTKIVLYDNEIKEIYNLKNDYTENNNLVSTCNEQERKSVDLLMSLSSK